MLHIKSMSGRACVRVRVLLGIGLLSLLSGCASKMKDGSVADIRIPAKLTKAEAYLAVAGAVTKPGHTVFDQAADAVPEADANVVKLFSKNADDSGNVTAKGSGTIHIDRRLHYFSGLAHRMDIVYYDYIVAEGVIKHDFTAKGNYAANSKRALRFIGMIDDQIRANLTALNATKK